MAGFKFRRQHPIPPYVLDFYCDQLKLAVEVDGGQHDEEQEQKRDRARSEFLNSKGIRVLRFWNNEVLGETEAVLETIYSEAQALLQPEGEAPPPNSLPKGGGTGTVTMLTDKEKTLHEQGLVSVLAQLHDELDTAVLEAYGWSDLAPALVGKPGGTTPYPEKSAQQAEAEETLLLRLVDLNDERAAEEQRGLVRWLRPEFQNPSGETAAQEGLESIETAQPIVGSKAKQAWPKSIPAQVQAVRETLEKQSGPVSAEQIARQFKRARTDLVQELLETLSNLGQARVMQDGRFMA